MKLCVKPIGWQKYYTSIKNFKKNIASERFILRHFCIIQKGKHYFAVCEGFRELTSGSSFSSALKKANLLELGYLIRKEEFYDEY